LRPPLRRDYATCCGTRSHIALNPEIPLFAGEFASLPSGSHRVLIGKNEAVSLVMVWELPAEFRLN
jgi:hypothetical protein